MNKSSYNFENAFNSPSFTLNRDAADIINGAATPNTDRNTFSDNQPGLCDIDDNRKQTPGTCTPSAASRIELKTYITVPGQTVTVNKYFANAHTINRGDGTTSTDLTADTTHTYTGAGIYFITLAFTGGADRWTFTLLYPDKPLVPTA